MNVILGADDFGASAEVNEAVLAAHRHGVLTSASLMVAGQAVDEAVAMARAMPGLAVGLHLVVVDGRAALPGDRIPHLIGDDGRFPGNPVRAGLRYTFSVAARRELAAELRAQFDRFANTGLPMAHVDGHHHMHLHPVVFDLLLPLAEEYGARGVRLPRDDLRLSLVHDRQRAATKALWMLIFGLLNCWCARRMRNRGLIMADRVYGLLQTGRMGESYVMGILRQLRVPTAEIYFHPSTAAGGTALGQNQGDMRTLLSPAVQQLMEERGIHRTSYLALGQ